MPATIHRKSRNSQLVTCRWTKTTTVSQAWGHPTGGAGSVLFQEGTFGPLVQTSWESFFGIDDAGQVCYSASGTGGPAGGFDSVWVNATPTTDPPPARS